MKRLIILLALTCASCQEKAKPRPAVIEGERTPFEGFVVDKKYEKNKGDHGWVVYYKDETKMTSHVKVYEKWVTEVKVGDKIFGYIEFGKSIATKYEAGKPPQRP